MHQITWFWPPKSKSPYRGGGGGEVPLPHPPPARSLRSLAFVLKIFSVFFLKSEIIFPPPPHFWRPVYATAKETPPPFCRCPCIWESHENDDEGEWDKLGLVGLCIDHSSIGPVHLRGRGTHNYFCPFQSFESRIPWALAERGGGDKIFRQAKKCPSRFIYTHGIDPMVT